MQPTMHINFEADIHYPEEAGVVQVETFGVSMSADGTVFYGMQVEAVLDRIKDNISLDHLSRLLVDVHIDSSKIVDSVISQYQRDLLNLIFMGDAQNRNKACFLPAPACLLPTGAHLPALSPVSTLQPARVWLLGGKPVLLLVCRLSGQWDGDSVRQSGGRRR